MSRRVELPGGEWAQVKDYGELTPDEVEFLMRQSGPAEPVAKKLSDQGVRPTGGLPEDPGAVEAVEALTSADREALRAIQRAAIVAYVVAWSLGPPPTLETVDELPTPIFSALLDALIEELGRSNPRRAAGPLN